MQRKIIHIDMDAFYASIEQRDFPKYKGKPLIVGGEPQKRGVVATCSYEARKHGIHAAMSSTRAYRLCPQAIFLKPRFATYQKISQQIHSIFYEYSDLVEPLSLDEAYLDVTYSNKCKGSATWIAKEIKQKILKRLSLSSSAGVSYNKFLAKVASGYKKPNGLTVVTPQNGEKFVENLKIRQFFGVGKVTEKKMHTLKIYTGKDLKKYDLKFLKEHFGSFSNYLYYAARAIDKRPVQTSRKRKSISKETTFLQDFNDWQRVVSECKKLAKKVFLYAEEKNILARTMTLKLKYSNFQLCTRSISLAEDYYMLEKIYENIPLLLRKTDIKERKVRLLGIGISNLSKKE